MTAKAVMSAGFNTRHEHGDTAKLAFLNQQSASRFMDLQWVLEARRINLRIANGRWRRRNGLTLKAA